MNTKERVINGLLGQAVADGVGNPFEFEDEFQEGQVVSNANSCRTIVISDDTQMAMFGLEAILNLNNFCDDYEAALIYSYSEWYLTQYQVYTKTHTFATGLLKYNQMFSRQAPGHTCLSAIKTLMDGKVVENDSCGCGSVMRLLPFVLLFDSMKFEEVLDIAIMSGNITHKHPQNKVATTLCMETYFDIIFGKVVPKNATSIKQLGEGWTALECVEMAIWAYSHAKTFDELLELSITHKGDSDSVAAIAGSFWGVSGKEVPEKYINKIDALRPIKYLISRIKNEII